MKGPTRAQLDVARTLFVREANGAEGAEECEAAARRILQKMFGRLAPLLGAAAARALFARAAKLAAKDFPRLCNVDFGTEIDPTEPLLTCLHGEAPATIVETTVALSATLLALLATLIGEGLTYQVLRGAWPDFDPKAAAEEIT